MRKDALASVAVIAVGLLVTLAATIASRSAGGFDVLGPLVWVYAGRFLVAAGAIALGITLLRAAFRKTPRTAPRPPNR